MRGVAGLNAKWRHDGTAQWHLGPPACWLLQLGSIAARSSAVQKALQGAGCSKGGKFQSLCIMLVAFIKFFLASAAARQLCMHTLVPSGESLQHCVAANMSTD